MTQEKMFYGLRYDGVFKNVFYRDEDSLRRFLSNLLTLYYRKKTKIKHLKIQNCELTKDRLYIRNKTVDILVDIGDKIINCEVNLNYQLETQIRNLCFLTQAVNESIARSEDYISVKEHIQFNINFMGKHTQGIEEIRFQNITTNKPEFGFIKMVRINVDYFTDRWYNLSTKTKFYREIESIVIFGLKTKEEHDNFKSEDDFVKKILNEVEKLNENPAFYQWMTDEEDREKLYNSRLIRMKQEGLEQGIEQGIEQGSTNEKINIAKNLLNMNVDINDISKATHLTKEQIEKLL